MLGNATRLRASSCTTPGSHPLWRMGTRHSQVTPRRHQVPGPGSTPPATQGPTPRVGRPSRSPAWGCRELARVLTEAPRAGAAPTCSRREQALPGLGSGLMTVPPSRSQEARKPRHLPVSRQTSRFPGQDTPDSTGGSDQGDPTLGSPRPPCGPENRRRRRGQERATLVRPELPGKAGVRGEGFRPRGGAPT